MQTEVNRDLISDSAEDHRQTAAFNLDNDPMAACCAGQSTSAAPYKAVKRIKTIQVVGQARCSFAGAV